MNKEDKIRRLPTAAGTDEELWNELAVITRDLEQSGEEVWDLRMQLANAQTLSARVALAAPQALETWGQRFPYSPDISWSDWTQWRGWIAQLQIFKWHKPARFPDKLLMMPYAFKCVRGVALRQILPHTWEDGTIGLGDLPGCINSWKQLLGTPTKWRLHNGKCGTWSKSSVRSHSTMLGFKLLLLIWIGILQLSRMPSRWCSLRESISPLCQVICPKNFLCL